MPRRQVHTYDIDDLGESSRRDDSVTTPSDNSIPHRHHDRDMNAKMLSTPDSQVLPTQLPTYALERQNTGTSPREAAAAPLSELSSAAAVNRAPSQNPHRSRRSLAASRQPFPGVSSVTTAQQRQAGEAGSGRRRSLPTTTTVGTGDCGSGRETEARRHHLRFLQLCGRVPQKRRKVNQGSSEVSTGFAAHAPTDTTATATASGLFDGTLNMRYGSGTRGVKERWEDEARQRAQARHAERALADTRRRRVSVFDRLNRRQSERLPRGDVPRQGLTLPMVLVPASGAHAAEGDSAEATSTVGGANVASLPVLHHGTFGSPYAAESRRGRSAPLVTVDQHMGIPHGQSSPPAAMDSHGAESDEASPGRTMRPAPRVVQYESGGIIDAFGYFPNHRTNADYYNNMTQERKMHQKRLVEVDPDSGAVVAAATRSQPLLTVPPMAEVAVDVQGRHGDRQGRRAGRQSKRGGGAPRSRSTSQRDQGSRHASSRRSHGGAGEKQALRQAAPGGSQRQYRFYTVAEDGAVRGFDMAPPAATLSTPNETALNGGDTSRGDSVEATAARGQPSGNRKEMSSSPQRSAAPLTTSGADTAHATAANEPAWLADADLAGAAPALAVRVSAANPYDDQHGQVVQTRVYPEAPASGGRLSLVPGRPRGASMASVGSCGRDRWGEPLTPPPQTATVVVRRYTNDNGSKPVRLHLPPGTSVEDLFGKEEFPSVSLPWL